MKILKSKDEKSDLNIVNITDNNLNDNISEIIFDRHNWSLNLNIINIFNLLWVYK